MIDRTYISLNLRELLLSNSISGKSFSEKVMVMYNSGSEKRGNLITSAI